MANKIIEIKEKLNSLKEMDQSYVVHGASSHKYILHPCLKETEIKYFENKYDIKLPKEYRNFLKYIGNGGAGPGYNFYSLNESSFHELQVPFIGFNLLEDIKHKIEECTFELDNFLGDLNLDKNIIEELKNEYDEIGAYIFHTGMLSVSYDGCNVYYYLVVNGKNFGSICVCDGDIDCFIEFYTDFYDFYLSWLNINLNRFEYIKDLMKNTDLSCVEIEKLFHNEFAAYNSSNIFEICDYDGKGVIMSILGKSRNELFGNKCRVESECIEEDQAKNIEKVLTVWRQENKNV